MLIKQSRSEEEKISSETLFLYNDSEGLIDSLSWDTDIRSSGDSWSFNGTGFEECTPTAGLENNCSIEQSCTPDCSGKECGDDGCGGSCGSCSGMHQRRLRG